MTVYVSLLRVQAPKRIPLACLTKFLPSMVCCYLALVARLLAAVAGV